ncbi:MAG: PAS domain S-box protein, partial [candidate division Zixibacteria bacterium]|nr:PAS domain S-box protein [candidate division Zixibacteria bacterium]
MSRASHMARRLLPCLLLIAVWLVPDGITAQTSLRVGVYDNKPKVFLDRDGNPQGIFIDILRTIANDEGWSLEFVPCTWDTCLRRLESGQIDLMPDVAYSNDRAQRFDFNDITILNNWAQVYASPGSEIESILDLEGRRLGVLTGDISYRQFANRLHAFDVECEFVEVDRFRAIFDSLDTGAIDAGLVSRLFGLEYERQYSAERTPVVCCPVELRFAATKGRLSSVLTLMDAHLLNLKSDKGSVYYQSFNRWLETDITPGRSTPYWIWWLLAGVGALVGLLLIHHGLLHMRLKRTTAELREKNQRLEAEVDVRSHAEEELRSHKAHLEQAVAIRTRELSESEKRYRSILENATVGIFRTTREGGVIMANPEVARLLGYESAEQVVREVSDLAAQVYYDPDDRQKVLTKMQEQGQAVMDLRLKRRDGTPITTRINMWMVTNESGGLRFIEGVLEDITERKQAEERIRLYRQIFMGSSDGITITSCEGDLLEFNPTMQKFLGRSAEELEGMKAAGMCVPEDGERINAALRERGRFDGEVRMQRRDDSQAYVDLSVFPVYRDEGELACWVGIGRDVTERREAEQALRQREEQYRGIFNNVIEGLLIFNTDGVVVEANPSVCEVFGYTRAEFIGKSGPDFVSDEAMPLFKDFIRSLETQDYYRCETPERRSDGSLMYIEVNGTNFQFRGERHLLAVIHDITDRHQAEIEIRQANEELRTKQYQLIQSEKMASLGMLVAGVANEI